MGIFAGDNGESRGGTSGVTRPGPRGSGGKPALSFAFCTTLSFLLKISFLNC